MSHESVREFAQEVILNYKKSKQNCIQVLKIPGAEEFCIDRAHTIATKLFQNRNNTKTFDEQLIVCFNGEISEYATNLIINPVCIKRELPIISNDETKTGQFWYDCKVGDMFIEVKSTSYMLKDYLTFKSFEQIETVYTNCHKLDIIIYHKIDEYYNVYPHMIMYGKTFSNYIKKSKFINKDVSSDMIYDHVNAIKDGGCWRF